MGDEKIIQELQAFDFSDCRPVKERLLERLLQLHRNRNVGKSLRSRWVAARMDESELDWVAAAGTGEGSGIPLESNGKR